MRRKGRHKWVPFIALAELDMIKKEDNLFKDSQAFQQMVDYARIGREVKKRKMKWEL